jgi:hypothetical protein
VSLRMTAEINTPAHRRADRAARADRFLGVTRAATSALSPSRPQ